jgi:hypothetical protein
MFARYLALCWELSQKCENICICPHLKQMRFPHLLAHKNFVLPHSKLLYVRRAYLMKKISIKICSKQLQLVYSKWNASINIKWHQQNFQMLSKKKQYYFDLIESHILSLCREIPLQCCACCAPMKNGKNIIVKGQFFENFRSAPERKPKATLSKQWTSFYSV